MRKIKFILAVGFLFFSFGKARAVENLGEFVIDDYQVNIHLEQNGDFLVSEKIVVDFSQDRHGIFREIPYRYQDDKKFEYNLKLKVLSIKNEKGEAYSFSQSKTNGRLILKIGDPNQLVSGRQVYLIDYLVQRGMRFFSDHSEIYWNAVGTEWPTEIGKIEGTVSFFQKPTLDQVTDLKCFAGSLGSKGENCSINFDENSGIVSFVSKGKSNAGEGLTIAIKLPPGFVTEPTKEENLINFLLDNFGFLLPLVALGVMFPLWRKYGREIDLKKTIIAQYAPPENFTPGQLGYLMKEKYQADFVSADLINLAVKGYLKIVEIPKDGAFKLFKKNDYRLELTKPWTETAGLADSEKFLLGGIFDDGKKTECKISDLKGGAFYDSFKKTKDKIKNEVEKAGCFQLGYANSRVIYLIGGVVMGFLFLMIGATLERIDLIFGGIVLGLILVAFSFVMSKKTAKGAEIFWQGQGFKEYINTAERYRVKFQEERGIFEKFLPYAMVFGLADKWAKAFEGIDLQKPGWYQSANAGTFNPIILASSLDDFSYQASIVSSPPSSSSSGFGGGGFSGGGGGGGGGGSW